MLDRGVDAAYDDSEYVHFWEAGAEARGEFHCADCGYGVTVQKQLPTCPMCSGLAWEQAATSRAASRPL